MLRTNLFIACNSLYLMADIGWQMAKNRIYPTMEKKLQFKPHFHVEVLADRGVLLLAEDESVLLTGVLTERVAPLLDGSYSADEIASLLSETTSPVEIHYLLIQLNRDGYIVEKDDALPEHAAHFLHQISSQSSTMPPLFPAVISIQTLGDIPAEEIARTLDANPMISIRETGDLRLVFSDDYLRSELSQVNREALRSRDPWLLVKPVGATVLIGPLFYPGITGCWACLAHRMEQHRTLHTLARKNDRSVPPLSSYAATLPSTFQMALQLTGNEVFRWSARREKHRLLGTIASFDARALEIRHHTLTRRPQCSECGDRDAVRALQHPPFDLRIDKNQTDHKARRFFNAKSDSRVVNPAATYEAYRHHISPLTGVVRRIRRIDVANDDIYIFSAGHNIKPVSGNADNLPAYLRDQSSGKGVSLEQARTSALCEALERYSGIYQGTEPVRRASFRELGDAAIHPNSCMHFSDDQYRTREAWHAVCPHAFQRVPIPFDENLTVDWSPLWSLTLESARYLPTAYCFFNYEGPHADACVPDSNGCAAGNTPEEAILQGFMELIERDSVSIWWYNRLNRSAVDIQSFRDPYFDDLLAHYASTHRELWALDLTTDLKIPVFAALSRRIDRMPEDIIMGFGAHFDAHVALRRALTEMNQQLPFVTTEDAAGNTVYHYNGVLELKWWKTATVENQPFLTASGNLPARASSDFAPHHAGTIAEDVSRCLGVARQHNLELLILNQSRPDIGLPVMKTVMPDLRVFWKRLGPGRLYETPVKMGWLPEPNAEDAMNPFPFFL